MLFCFMMPSFVPTPNLIYNSYATVYEGVSSFYKEEDGNAASEHVNAQTMQSWEAASFTGHKQSLLLKSRSLSR